MAFTQLLLNLTPHPALSLLIAAVLLVLILFLARTFFYPLVNAATRAVHSAARLAASSILQLEKRLSERNRQVLAADRLENTVRSVDRDRTQFQSAVTKYFHKYTTLHRRIAEAVNRIEADYRSSMDVPPSLPNWQPILEAVSRIETRGDTPVGALLKSIDRTLQDQHRETLAHYAGSVKNRQAILGRLVPHCVRLKEMMEGVDRSLHTLDDRAGRLDRSMQRYERMRAEDSGDAPWIALSSLTQLLISGLVLAVAACGAVINFHLMELPMSEVFGGENYLGPFKISHVAAAVITAIELSLGIFLVESLGITRMFPIIAALDDRMRTRLGWIALVFLTAFAILETAMGLLRVQMVADLQDLHQVLAGVQPTDAVSSKIPAIGQMILGFVLPFWIACSAVPLASFALAARTVGGSLAALALRSLAFGLRLCGNAAVHIGRVAIALYDLTIFPVLLLDSSIGKAGAPRMKRPADGGLLKRSVAAFRKPNENTQWSEKAR